MKRLTLLLLLLSSAAGCDASSLGTPNASDKPRKARPIAIDGGTLVECEVFCEECGKSLGPVYTNHPVRKYVFKDDKCKFCGGRTMLVPAGPDCEDMNVAVSREFFFRHLPKPRPEPSTNGVEL